MTTGEYFRSEPPRLEVGVSGVNDSSPQDVVCCFIRGLCTRACAREGPRSTRESEGIELHLAVSDAAASNGL
jgi:hypothetical protein